ncbi:succinate dehydrogenase, cytochrome b556 subunit [Denitratisoma oestradiolicum]|uniref:Succinate dehydrogenase cytochrome b556 subunit n=1 Tax=Denitratisoma oestradiolicum TaxID=311182 RepID=A0A6S6Y9Q0_9PROT|nr:succinate dehydrogenase, cytochrome b556 subunit [Denitratisoma oestradiolicum]TWO80225.1 succinate dehydrogenase, cytochrome b556 subunit [Denitratisoma oestradiolicum]CAB1369312.1 Succinate dehydrogenase [Denitratisoma oestradiolicum]
MPEITIKQRPKFLTLWEIRLPIPGIVSILHRVSGAGLFLALPFLLCLLQLSLGSAENILTFKQVTGNLLVKLVLFGLCWAYIHHFCAGIRFLLMDVHVGVDKAPSRASAKAVLVVSLGLTALVAMKFLGVF